MCVCVYAAREARLFDVDDDEPERRMKYNMGRDESPPRASEQISFAAGKESARGWDAI